MTQETQNLRDYIYGLYSSAPSTHDVKITMFASSVTAIIDSFDFANFDLVWNGKEYHLVTKQVTGDTTTGTTTYTFSSPNASGKFSPSFKVTITPKPATS